VPSHFISHETDQPFTHCCACHGKLRELGAHIVNQSYVNGECVFELAMCLPCREAMNKALSEESRVAMFDFMHDHADLEAREQTLGSDSPTADYLAHCLTCGTPQEKAKSFSVGAMFTGDTLLKGPFPMLICGSCEEKINDVISKETREVWDDFIAENFPAPPSEVNLPTTKPVLM